MVMTHIKIKVKGQVVQKIITGQSKLTKGRIAVHGAHMQMVLMWTAKLNTTNIHALPQAYIYW